MKRTILTTLIAGVLALAGYAFAQVITQPQVPVNQNDLVQIVRGGVATAQNQYAAPGMIGGTTQYQYSVPVTAFSIQALNNTWFVLLNPAGTLATGTITTPVTPGDGQRLCVMSSQTQTALTMTAATGQAFASYGLGAVTALTANTPVCWFFIGSQAVWVRYQ
jgi:hypothetical protein